MHKLIVLVDNAVAHIRLLLAVVEEQQFAGLVVYLRMCRHAPVERKPSVPALLAERIGRVRVDPIQIAALVEASQRDTSVDDDVVGLRVLHEATSAPAVFPLGQLHRFCQTRPQRPAGLVLGQESIGANKSVAVEGFSITEADDMDHAVAIEGVVGRECRV